MQGSGAVRPIRRTGDLGKSGLTKDIRKTKMRALRQCTLTVLLFAGPTAFGQSPPIPDQERQFLSIVDDFAAKYKAAPNDFAKGGLRLQRAKALCGLMRSPAVENWVGTVRTLSSNNAGKGTLAVFLGKHTNSSIVEVLVEPGTPVHEAAGQLRNKQRVVFSGVFTQGDKDCFKESSFTQKGAMTSPFWRFAFSSIKPAK